MKEQVKILFITQEINPYLQETEIADICRQFPQYIQEQGCEIRTFMPCYGHINERRNQLHEVQRLSGLNIIIDDSDHPLIIKVASIQAARMQVYFIDNEDYFRRRGITCGPDGIPFDDNDERAIFFVRSVLETIKKLRWTPDIICCNGWITSLAPLFIKRVYNSDPFFENSKVIYTIYDEDHNNPIKAGFEKRILFDGIDPEDVKTLKGRTMKTTTLHKLAVDFSDGIISATPNIQPDVERYIKKSKTPYLPYSEERDFRLNYRNFIASIYPPLKQAEEE